jgi:nucleotide-binding universal stress UspA family protein
MKLNPRILVALDDSENAPMVAEEGSKISSQMGADVVILSVVPVIYLASEGEIDDQSLSEEEKKLHSLHATLIARYFTASGGLVESKVLYGDPAAKICEYAETMDADTIVLGSSGKSRIEAFLLGSVSEGVAKHSRRSVMIVKPNKKQRGNG